MTRISIACRAAPDERGMIDRALVDILAEAAKGESATVDSCMVEDDNALLEQQAGTIRILSLLSKVDDLGTPWPQIEASLSKLLEALEETGDPVLIMTVFRHVADGESDEGYGRLIRIRRLNLLATELSRKFGAFVIDLDRVLADIGGVALACDYRLQSSAAIDRASEEVALSIVANGLVDLISFDAQARLTAAIEATRSCDIRAEAALSPADLVALGRGRNRQRVSINTSTVQESHAGWLISQVLGGRISLAEAAHRLVTAVRRRGLHESAALIISALRHVIARRRHAS